MRILGVIPARGGSKGIPRKNIRMIAGKPLLLWTIEAAKKSKLMQRFVVSTEDVEIAQICQELDVEVLKRPQELASDKATTLSVLEHALFQIQADIVVLLQPTTPVRDDGLIDACIQRFLESGADNLATGFICKILEYGKDCGIRRQDIKGFFCADGNVYVYKSGLIKSGKSFGKKVERMIISREQNLDIDDEFDFWLAEQVLLKRKFSRRL